MTAQVERLTAEQTLAELEAATERLVGAEREHRRWVAYALRTGCPLRLTAEAAGMSYDALRMRRSRDRRGAPCPR